MVPVIKDKGNTGVCPLVVPKLTDETPFLDAKLNNMNLSDINSPLVVDIVLAFWLNALDELEHQRGSVYKTMEIPEFRKQILRDVMMLMWTYEHQITGMQIAQNFGSCIKRLPPAAQKRLKEENAVEFLKTKLYKFNTVQDVTKEFHKEDRIVNKAKFKLREMDGQLKKIKVIIHLFEQVQVE